MTKKDKFFFFGYGQSAKYFIEALIKSKKKFQFNATNTKKTISKIYKKKFISINLKIRFMTKNLKIN